MSSCHGTCLTVSPHGSRLWLCVIREQAITWIHTKSLDALWHNPYELNLDEALEFPAIVAWAFLWHALRSNFLTRPQAKCLSSVLNFPIVCLFRMFLDTLRPEWNGWHFADDIFKHIMLHENILCEVSLILICEGSINGKSSLIEVMSWCAAGDSDKP